ncbi:MAG TPA: TonB-dependent receptor plug domain-containing protein, partial [Leptospiraceae bacterium]|nr:TonB-dependent receptor plug domain-containing protein [Leptospiraceae bacterium]
MFAQEIEVTGKKRTLGDQPAATSEIPVSDYAGRFETLEDILEKETSVRVKRYGGPGSQSSISVRGSNANQTNLYLDGIPLNNAVSGEANLADYNLDGVGSIQVFRSGQSSGFSGSAIGGSVNLVPERGESGTRLRLRGGTERTIDVAARAGGSRNPEEAEKEETEKAKVDPSLLDAMRAQWSVSGHTGRSDQTYKYRNNNGTPVFNTFDDHDDRRKNAWYRDDGFTGYASAGVGNTDLKILDDFTYRMHGVPGPGSRQTEKTHRELTRNTTGIGSDTRGLGVDWIRLETRAYYTYYRESFFDPLQEFSTSSPNSSGKLDVYGIHLMPSLYFPVAFQTIRFLFAEEREDYHQEIRNRLDQKTENVPARFRRHTSLHAEDEFSFFKKRL